MGKVVPARIDGIVAREAPVAVIFRAGPIRQTQLLTWNLDTDEIVPGQWIIGRVYSRRCDLSPDGKLLIGAFKKHPYFTGAWTAISRPPYFSAIAVWFGLGRWNGGGLWRGNQAVEVNVWADAKNEVPPPPWLSHRRLNLPMSEDEPIFGMRLRAYGWTCLQDHEVEVTNPGWKESWERLFQFSRGPIPHNREKEIKALIEESSPRYRTTRPGLWSKPFPEGRFERVQDDQEEWRIVDLSGNARKTFRPEVFERQFLDVDHRGRVVFGDKGCLWAWEGFPDGEPTMIADLSPNRFEEIAPPKWAVSRNAP